jgi:hypothetical protein
MKAISQFEEFLEGLVEGSLRRLFRGRLEPVDLARRLARVMDDNKRVTWERPLVPNQYQITLAESDYADIESFVESLARELEKFAVERCAERGYSMPAPAEVSIAADQTLSPASFQVRAALVDTALRQEPAQVHEERPSTRTVLVAPTPEDIGQTRAMRPLEMPLGPTGFETLYLVGEVAGRQVAWPVGGSRVTIGRGLDNDVVLEDASVSRHHAQLTRDGSRLEVRDLGSRNGTWVNAARIAVTTVHPGDQVAFGAVQLELARRPGQEH